MRRNTDPIASTTRQQNANDQTLDAVGRGEAAKEDWRRLQAAMRPLAKAATVVPPLALRFDPGAPARRDLVFSCSFADIAVACFFLCASRR